MCKCLPNSLNTLKRADRKTNPCSCKELTTVFPHRKRVGGFMCVKWRLSRIFAASVSSNSARCAQTQTSTRRRRDRIKATERFDGVNREVLQEHRHQMKSRKTSEEGWGSTSKYIHHPTPPLNTHTDTHIHAFCLDSHSVCVQFRCSSFEKHPTSQSIIQFLSSKKDFLKLM